MGYQGRVLLEVHRFGDRQGVAADLEGADFATGRMFTLSNPPAVTQDPGTIANQVYEATAQALAFSFAQRDPPALASAANRR